MIDAKAYVLRETGVVPSLEDIRVSDDLKPGQVLVRVLYSGLCATQMEEIFVSSRNAKYMPHLFGHEGVGVVEAIGPGVETKKPGDVCVIHWRPSSVGLDATPGAYFANNNKLNSGKVVTFSTHVVVPENRITPLPLGFPLEAASLLGCSMTTGWGSTVKVGLHNSASRVLVLGIGAVGTFAALAASILGSETVVGIDPKFEFELNSPTAGLSHSFKSLDELAREVGASLSIKDFDLVIETSGRSEVIEKLIEELPLHARLVLVGMPSSRSLPLLNFQRLLDGLSIVGSNGGGTDPGKDIGVVAELFRNMVGSQLLDQLQISSAENLRLAVDSFGSPGILRFILQMSGVWEQSGS